MGTAPAAEGDYTGENCVHCGRERVLIEDGRRVCEKCRWDQDAQAYRPEPDPIDTLLRGE